MFSPEVPRRLLSHLHGSLLLSTNASGGSLYLPQKLADVFPGANSFSRVTSGTRMIPRIAVFRRRQISRSVLLVPPAAIAGGGGALASPQQRSFANARNAIWRFRLSGDMGAERICKVATRGATSRWGAGERIESYPAMIPRKWN